MLQHVAFYQSHASEGVHKQQEKLTHEDNAFSQSYEHDCCPKCVLIEEKSNVLNISFPLPVLSRYGRPDRPKPTIELFG